MPKSGLRAMLFTSVLPKETRPLSLPYNFSMCALAWRTGIGGTPCACRASFAASLASQTF
eukprot:321256-Pleurochrysis_carterae.AAC.1